MISSNDKNILFRDGAFDVIILYENILLEHFDSKYCFCLFVLSQHNFSEATFSQYLETIVTLFAPCVSSTLRNLKSSGANRRLSSVGCFAVSCFDRVDSFDSITGCSTVSMVSVVVGASLVVSDTGSWDDEALCYSYNFNDNDLILSSATIQLIRSQSQLGQF